MATQYTSLLGLALPVTGELSGTWGNTVNDAITSLLDTAVAGATTLSTDADVTLSTTTGAANQARQAIILWTANGTVTRNITAPAQSKIYTVINASTGTQSIVLRGVGPTTGVTIVKGESAVVAWNGSDFIKISNTGGAGSFTNVTVSGTTTLSGLTASTALALDASKNVVSVTNTGTGNNVLSASPTLTGTVAGASLQLSSLTATRVTYAGASGLLTDSANMTFNGTRLTVADLADSGLTSGRVTYATTGGNLTDSTNLTFDGTALTLGGNPTLSAGTANGVAYLNGSKVLTTGSALVFDGTNLGIGRTPRSVAGYGILSIDGSNGGATDWYANGTRIFTAYAGTTAANISTAGAIPLVFQINDTEGMRLTSTGLGIGTSSPAVRLQANTDVVGISTPFRVSNGLATTNGRGVGLEFFGSSNTFGRVEGFWDGTDQQLRLFSTGSTAFFSGGTTERMRLDSSGNLGLGVTPSAWASTHKALQMNWSAFSTDAGNGETSVSTNAYASASTTWNYRSGGAPAARYTQDYYGAHKWYSALSGDAGSVISFTQAMTLDASGRLGVGTTSPGYPVDIVADSSTWTANFRGRSSDNVAYVRFSSNNGATTYAAIGSPAANTLGFDTGGAERARITSGGALLVNRTAVAGAELFNVTGSISGSELIRFYASHATNPYGQSIIYTTADPNGTANEFFTCYGGGATIRASIRSNGGIANYSANNVNLSDRREKTNFAPAKSYLDTICAIPVQTFNYIDQSEDDPGLTLGVVAQDVQAVAPELVMESNWGTKEDPKMRLSIYQTDLQYALMKCIQELKAEVDSLKAQLKGA